MNFKPIAGVDVGKFFSEIAIVSPAELLGCVSSVDKKWDGVNISPFLFGEIEKSCAKIDERVFYWNINHDRFAVRYGEWKLIIDKREGHDLQELFNISTECRPP